MEHQKKSKQSIYDWMEDGFRKESAARSGNRKPYHLQYAETYKDNEIINPHLKGAKNDTECKAEADNRRADRPAAGRKKKRRIYTAAAGPMLSGCHRKRDQGGAGQ